MLMAWPPTFSTPERGLPLEFAATVTDSVPAPVPSDGETAAQGAPLLASHEQPAELTEIATEPVPPALPKGLPSDEVSRLTVQANPCCVMARGVPPIVSVPVRVTLVELAFTV